MKAAAPEPVPHPEWMGRRCAVCQQPVVTSPILSTPDKTVLVHAHRLEVVTPHNVELGETDHSPVPRLEGDNLTYDWRMKRP